jgi:hypothetical protein
MDAIHIFNHYFTPQVAVSRIASRWHVTADRGEPAVNFARVNVNRAVFVGDWLTSGDEPTAARGFSQIPIAKRTKKRAINPGDLGQNSGNS